MPCANVCVNPLKWKSLIEPADEESPLLGNNELAICHQFPRKWGSGYARVPNDLGKAKRINEL